MLVRALEADEQGISERWNPSIPKVSGELYPVSHLDVGPAQFGRDGAA
jgi:hypothetical protein